MHFQCSFCIGDSVLHRLKQALVPRPWDELARAKWEAAAGPQELIHEAIRFGLGQEMVSYSPGDERQRSNNVYAPFPTNLDGDIVIGEGRRVLRFRQSKNCCFPNIVNAGT